jgi:uncharacterized lipoprotein YmbA
MIRKMRTFRLATSWAAVTLLAGFIFTACSLPDIQQAQPDTSRYYVLGGVSPSPAGARPDAPRLAVRMVEVAPYLKNKSLVVRQGDNELKFVADARWGEPLDAGLTRLIRERLAATTGTPVEPEAGLETDYVVRIRVERCEGTVDGTGGNVSLTAEIDLRPAAPTPTGRPVRRMFVARPAAWDGKDFARMARLLSEAAGELADAVLAAVPERK